MAFSRITIDPAQMGGRPCIRGLRVTVGLAGAGFEAVHVGEVDLLTASDAAIVDYARANDLVIITVDSDSPNAAGRTSPADRAQGLTPSRTCDPAAVTCS